MYKRFHVFDWILIYLQKWFHQSFCSLHLKNVLTFSKWIIVVFFSLWINMNISEGNVWSKWLYLNSLLSENRKNSSVLVSWRFIWSDRLKKGFSQEVSVNHYKPNQDVLITEVTCWSTDLHSHHKPQKHTWSVSLITEITDRTKTLTRL